VAKVQGRGIEFDALTRDSVDSPTEKKIPSMLVPVVALTKENIKDTVIQDGVYTVQDICTPEYAAACAEIGLK
jgi:D-xylose transport system substrate-binding protein